MAKKPTTPATATAAAAIALMVRAKVPGLYGEHRKEGAEFELAKREDLAPWMIPVGWDPETGAPTEPTAADKPAAKVTDAEAAELLRQLEAVRGQLADAVAGLNGIGEVLVTVPSLPETLNHVEAVAWVVDELARAKDVGVAEFLADCGFKAGDLLEIQEDGSVRATPAREAAADGAGGTDEGSAGA